MRGFVILLVVVLAGIGIGVGVEAAVGPVTYGPPGYGFRVAFSVPVEHESVDLAIGSADAYGGSSAEIKEVAVVVVGHEGRLSESAGSMKTSPSR